MLKKKKQKKSKKEPEEKKEEKEKKEEVSEESDLEEDVSDKIIKQESFAKFTVSTESRAPVLEKITEAAPEPELIQWSTSELNPREEEKKTSEYEPLEKTATKEYTPRTMETDIASGPPVLRTESIDISTVGRGRATMGREFHMTQPAELQSREEDYEPLHPGAGFELEKAGREKEQVGRKYKPKAH